MSSSVSLAHSDALHDVLFVTVTWLLTQSFCSVISGCHCWELGRKGAYGCPCSNVEWCMGSCVKQVLLLARTCIFHTNNLIVNMTQENVIKVSIRSPKWKIIVSFLAITLVLKQAIENGVHEKLIYLLF